MKENLLADRMFTSLSHTTRKLVDFVISFRMLKCLFVPIERIFHDVLIRKHKKKPSVISVSHESDVELSGRTVPSTFEVI